jgi:hypothetical protein|nr:MAG TPA: hypothetical protein [Caudoviricetes sp.]
MLLESLYRVFFDSQKVVLQDARTQKILWKGVVGDIPLEYLNYHVTVAMSCALSKKISEIVLIIS